MEGTIMSLRINQNTDAFNSYRNLSVTQGQLSKSLEKLSSGFRINRAADDAAGLAISEGLRAQVGGVIGRFGKGEQLSRVKYQRVCVSRIGCAEHY